MGKTINYYIMLLESLEYEIRQKWADLTNKKILFHQDKSQVNKNDDKIA